MYLAWNVTNRFARGMFVGDLRSDVNELVETTLQVNT